MNAAYLRALRLAVAASLLLPVVVATASKLHSPQDILPEFWLLVAGCAVAAIGAALLLARWLGRIESQLETEASEQSEFLAAIPDRCVGAAIAGAAALSLFVELALIRWQGSVVEFFAFYKNFGLLACFAGLGFGYALATRRHIPLMLTVPLLGWQFLLLIGMRYAMPEEAWSSLRALPVVEQFEMGLPQIRNVWAAASAYSLLAVVFVLTALALIPIGQVCGRLMQRRAKLRAYGLNLIGSLAGVLLMFAVSALWAPPLVWFAMAFGGVLLLTARNARSLVTVAGSTIVALVALAWPVDPLWQKVHSPYQLLEFGYGENGMLNMRAAGHYYQRVHNLSDAAVATDRQLRDIRAYYDLPYRVHAGARDVAIVGAGTGNDVAAALRAAVARVDAIEIDPAILMAGRAHHPEHPYDDPRVNSIVNDARAFLRTTERRYDLVVYGMLDSHTLLSHASSVRLDSFVYTTEALREARSRLADDGVLALSFSVMNDALGHKIYLMMQGAFDGRPPLCVQARYDHAVFFLQRNRGEVVIPEDLLREGRFYDKGSEYGNPLLAADVSTDDWPFFYMPRRVYPLSYVPLLMLLLVLSVWMARRFFPESLRLGDSPFFFLGAGFMLIETKGITEMGLAFGNTWHVIGLVIAGILLMAFCANALVAWLGVRRPVIPYALLLASLAAGWWVSRAGGFEPTLAGRAATLTLLTLPVFFSGMVFSTLLATRGEIAGVMAVNLLGAMLGGLVEYNSMYFGFQALYWMAAAFYVCALASSRLRTAPAGAVNAAVSPEV